MSIAASRQKRAGRNEPMANKIIISCAITGSIHTPTMSDALPITPDQIATQAIDAAKAGAAILHLHARDPKDGRPTSGRRSVHAVPAAHQAGDRRGGEHHHRRRRDHDGRAAHLGCATRSSPEMCSLNMGSMNFALYPMAQALQGLEIRLGEGLSRQFRRLHLPQHVSRHREGLQDARRRPRREVRA